MNQLKAKLYELEKSKRDAEKDFLEENKADIGWGNQIRSYVLDQSRVKDLRTGLESSNPESILDGNIESFLEYSLKKGIA